MLLWEFGLLDVFVCVRRAGMMSGDVWDCDKRLLISGLLLRVKYNMRRVNRSCH